MDSDNRNTFAIKTFLKDYLDLRKDKDNELETVDSIRKGVEFKGANLWILIFAIFMASLGLNVNSTAVIIGAMLISPLMGPIMGVGLSVGLNDFELMKRSLKSFLITTLFSVTTATIFFLVSPVAEGQSELLARTSPTIYDVFIALMGGLAGVTALFTRNLFANDQHHRIYYTCTLRFVHIRFYCSKYPTGHVLLVQEEADVKFRIRQFFTKITCHKAVFQIVVLHRRVLLYAAEAAVMIGKHQPVPGHHHSGTKASEADYRILQRRAFRIV